jgi:hypothetical protein
MTTMHVSEHEVAAVVGELIERRRDEIWRRAQQSAASRLIADRDPYNWTDQLTTSSGAKRYEMKQLLADMIRRALALRDATDDPVHRDRFHAEAARLSSLEARL